MPNYRPLLVASLLLMAGAVATGDGCSPPDAACLRAAAEAGDAEAQTAVGALESLDDRGAAEVVDLEVATFRRGPISARVVLADPERPLPGFPHDEADAARWFAKAAAQGQAEAQYSLGLLYLLGHGVQADSAKAAAWLVKAAEQDVVGAQIALAVHRSAAWLRCDDHTNPGGYSHARIYCHCNKSSRFSCKDRVALLAKSLELFVFYHYISMS